MDIPSRLITKWKKQKEHGDIKAISETSGISELTISNAFNKKKASKETIKAINKFYTDKPEMKKQAEKALIQELD